MENSGDSERTLETLRELVSPSSDLAQSSSLPLLLHSLLTKRPFSRTVCFFTHDMGAVLCETQAAKGQIVAITTSSLMLPATL